jgi:hypothetical protein
MPGTLGTLGTHNAAAVNAALGARSVAHDCLD